MSLKHSVRTEITDLYRGINKLKVYQPTTNTVNDETGGRLADFHSKLNRWKN